jgi:hypothetical protein
MLGHSPISSTPISALPDVSLGDVAIIGEAILMARLNNPLAELVSDPRKRLVLAVEITAVPIGV